MLSALTEAIGITEAEVRRWSQHPYMDRYYVREWNGRTHEVAAVELVNQRPLSYMLTAH